MAHAGKKGSRAGRVRVGDRAMLQFGFQDVPIEVLEDRGPLGVGGRQIVRIKLIRDPMDGEVEFEVPAEELKDLQPGPRQRGRY